MPSYSLMEKFDMSPDLLPEYGPSFSTMGYVSSESLEALGISYGQDVALIYRSGDQPNNAWSRNGNETGVTAGTGGTSAVLYGISENPVIDQTQRTNTFAHVNYQPEKPRTGTLPNINGAGILYSWIRKNIISPGSSYGELEERASGIPVGSDGLVFLPYGHGAERMLGNKTVNAHHLNLDLNRHTDDHIIRAGLEGVGYAYVYGYEIMKELGGYCRILLVGTDNLVQSDPFSVLIAALCDVEIEIRIATGAVGADLGSGVGSGYYKTIEEAMARAQIVRTIFPDPKLKEEYEQYYQNWKKELQNKLERL